MVSRPKRPRDTNQLAKLIVALSTGEAVEALPDAGKDPAAVLRGRSGGLKGGQARADALSARKRKQIAKKAASARWSKK
ncbi:MAG: histone H1 [Gammaproteobacteria bacterium RIFCSPLOWO2_02_FULL_61_13]|nr:MAG: histone H1 [Gammaproteobacteria bacterium RIFCSPLOWO2_02_FULL_61_13]